jgi:hypothetical protein
LPKTKKCLAIAAPKTDRLLSMDCYLCPYTDHAAINTMQQQGHLFLSGDDAKANSEIANLIEHLGFAAITSASWRKVGHLSSSGDRWLPST